MKSRVRRTKLVRFAGVLLGLAGLGAISCDAPEDIAAPLIGEYRGVLGKDLGPASNPAFGVVEVGLSRVEDTTEVKRIVGLVRQSGAKMLRETFYWPLFQPTAVSNWSGVWDTTVVKRAHFFLRVLADSGIVPYVTLEGTPPWARNCPSNSVLPEHNGGRTDCYSHFPPAQSHWLPWYYFVRDMVAEFPEVTYWGIWNEPNVAHFLQPLPDTTWNVAYWHLFVWAADAIHAGGKVIAGPELAGGNSSRGWSQTQEFLWFVENLNWKMTANDKLTVHHYNTTALLDQLADYYRWAANVNGLSSNEIWVTEGATADGMFDDDQEAQAIAVTDRYAYVTNNSRGVTKHFWMPFSRQVGTPAQYPEYRPPIVDAGVTPAYPRLAYDCFRALARGLALPGFCDDGLQVTIDGPFSVPAGQSGEWTAWTNVPDNPTITWRIDGYVVGTGSTLTHAWGGDYTLEVEAVNARGHRTSAQRYITVCGPNCF